MSKRMVGVERLVGGGVARPQPMAAAGTFDRHTVCHRTAYRQQLAPCRRCERRLPRLLLLPRPTWTQGRFGCHTTFSARVADLALARPAAGGDRRLPHEAVRTQGRRGGHPPQSHARPRRPEVPVWTRLGHAVARAAASVVGPAGFAAASHALRASEDDSLHPEETWLAISDQARIGSALGEMDCPAGEKSGKDVGWSSMVGIPRSPS